MATEAEVRYGADSEARRSEESSPLLGEAFPGAVQKYWTPNMGCNIRVDLSTGVPEYKEYLDSISWAKRSGLRHCGGDNTVGYFGSVKFGRWECV